MPQYFSHVVRPVGWRGRTSVLSSWLAVFLACAFSAPAVAGEETVIRLGVCLPLSGEYSVYGGLVLAGIRIRQDEANAAAGETSPRVELVVRDNKSDETTAVRQVRELATGEKVRLIIGPCLSSLLPAMADEAARQRVILISPAASMSGLGKQGDWAFSLIPGDDWQGRVLASLANKRLRVKRAGIIFNKNLPYSRSIAESFQQAFEQLGGEVVIVESYSARVDEGDLVDYGMLLEHARVADPDILLLPTYFDEAAAIISQSTYLDIRSRFIGADGWAGETLLLSAGNNLEGAYYISPYGPDNANPAMANFVKQLEMSNYPTAEKMSVLGYDALSLALHAMAGGGDGEAIRQRLRSLHNFPLATGELTCDPDFGIIKTTYVDQVIREGDRMRSKTVNVITADMMLESLKRDGRKE